MVWRGPQVAGVLGRWINGVGGFGAPMAYERSIATVGAAIVVLAVKLLRNCSAAFRRFGGVAMRRKKLLAFVSSRHCE
jgi:hypothetical protein